MNDAFFGLIIIAIAFGQFLLRRPLGRHAHQVLRDGGRRTPARSPEYWETVGVVTSAALALLGLFFIAIYFL